MTQQARQVGITRRFDLSPYADGWDGSYAVLRLASYREKLELRDKDFTQMTDNEATDFMFEMATDRFIRGQIMVLNDEGALELVDMAKDDVGNLPIAAIGDMYFTIMGVALDPKATQTATATPSTETPTTESSPAETNTKAS